jgi:hypothetical protein
MKHLVLMPIWATLLLLSFVIGGVYYLYSFNKDHFLKGVKVINSKLPFVEWYIKR